MVVSSSNTNDTTMESRILGILLFIFCHFESILSQFSFSEHVVGDLLKTNPRLVLQETPPPTSWGFLSTTMELLSTTMEFFSTARGRVSCRTNLGFVCSNSSTTYSKKKKKLKKVTFKMAKSMLLKYSPSSLLACCTLSHNCCES